MSFLRSFLCFASLALLTISMTIACGDDSGNTMTDTGPSCMDGIKNGDETHRDCGGSCSPCTPGNQCIVGEDCTEGVCRSGFCTMAACNDEVKNGDELDVDCGGACGTCAGGQVCIDPTDCTSGVCQNGVCADTSCEDNELNVNETDIDCGGPDCEPCAEGGRCESETDCASKVCQGGNCLAPTCSDGRVNQDESDQDCGGSECDACNDGANCNAPSDCQSENCDRGTCISCVDGIQNGDETGRDCGGSCDGCPAGQGCVDDGDCNSNLCIDNVCKNPGCEDERKNADETDVDCGGPECEPCANTLMCLVGPDCASRVCDSTCSAPTCNDKVLNGAELDVDCGSTCGKCGDFRGCTTGTDCESGTCTASNTCTVNCDISIGPDGHDYRGCLYRPNTLSCPDISSSGTPLDLAHNAGSTLIDLGFSFEYYGRTYTKVAVQSNGALSFAEGDLEQNNDSLASFNTDRLPTSPPYDFISIYWDSLRPKYDDNGTADPSDDDGVMGSNIRYQKIGTEPNRMFVVRWETPRAFSSDKLGIFVGVLHENGEISACYEATSFDTDFTFYDDGDSATAGLHTKDDVFLISHNNENLTAGTEIRYTPN